jgi:uncharacterized protein YbgA (DUF1722 family)/uncharacterized protein YbbK (DUF523 family)
VTSSDVIRIGVSACLLGREVRYDGGHKYDRFVADTLGGYVSFVPVCPEFEIGLGVPRETLRLVRSGDGVRLIGMQTGTDHTVEMTKYATRKVRELEKTGLCGYVLKKNSPSCGMERVKVYTNAGMPSTSGTGLFAETLLRELSLLPIEEEGRLNDPRLRENFIERVFAYYRLRALFRERWTIADLVRFQEQEKLLLMAHEPSKQRELGRLVAGAKQMPRAAVRDAYTKGFMHAIAKPTQPRRHVNVLQHAAGYLKTLIDAQDRHELLDVIEEYRREIVPLVVPITLLRHHVRKYDVSYLRGQSYLEPHPKELMLRNHV